MNPTPENVINALASSDIPLSAKGIMKILDTNRLLKVRGILIELSQAEVIRSVGKSWYTLIEMSYENPIAGAVRQHPLKTELAAATNRKHRIITQQQTRIHARRDSRTLAPNWPVP